MATNRHDETPFTDKSRTREISTLLKHELTFRYGGRNYKLRNGVLGDFLGIGIQTVSKDLETVEDSVTRVASDLRLMNSNSGAHPHNIPMGPSCIPLSAFI